MTTALIQPSAEALRPIHDPQTSTPASLSVLNAADIEALFNIEVILDNEAQLLATSSTFLGAPTTFKVALSEDKVAQYNAEGTPAGLFLPDFPVEKADSVIGATFLAIGSGMSHWAVLLPQHGVSGCILSDMATQDGTLVIGDHTVHEDDWLTFDGKGHVYTGKASITYPDLNAVPSIPGLTSAAYDNGWDTFIHELAEHSHTIRSHNNGLKLGIVTTNPDHITQAARFGAECNALFRTEDVFYGPAHRMLKDYLLHDDACALENIKAHLKKHITAYLEQASTLPGQFPTNIRLFDVPLKDWSEQEQKALLDKYGDTLLNKNGELVSGGPLLAANPTLYRAQVEAIYEAIKETDYKKYIGVAIHNVTDITQVYTVDGFINDLKRCLGGEYNIGMNIHDDTLALEPELIKKISPMVNKVIIGANDLTADITGISRKDFEAIEQYQRDHNLTESIYKKLAPEVLEIVKSRIALWKEYNPDISVIFSSGHGMKSMSDIHAMGIDYLGVFPSEKNLTLANIQAMQIAEAHPRL